MSAPLSLGLLTGPASPLLASQICGGGGPFFWLNKDFLVNTLTWPVVFGEDFRGSSWDHLSARVTLMLPPNPGS